MQSKKPRSDPRQKRLSTLITVAATHELVSVQPHPLCHLERRRARGEAKSRDLQCRNEQAAFRSLDSVPLTLHFTRDDRMVVHLYNSIRIRCTQGSAAFVLCSPGWVRRLVPGAELEAAETAKSIRRTQVCLPFILLSPGWVQGACPLAQSSRPRKPREAEAFKNGGIDKSPCVSH